MDRFNHQGLPKRSQSYVWQIPSPDGARQADFEQPRAKTALACQERRSSGCATLLAVGVSEPNALFCDPINIWRLVAHHSIVHEADIELANIIAPDNKNIWFFRLCDTTHPYQDEQHCD